MTDMMGKWEPWFRGVTEPEAIGDTTTYEMAAEFLKDCNTVEDWGIGKGFFKTLRPDAIGVDGTATPFSDVVADLIDYKSKADGILLRHVLEHNYRWEQVLLNARNSADKKLFIAIFTPIGDRTMELAYTQDVGVPDMSFCLQDLLEVICGAGEFGVETGHLNTITQYGGETVIKATRL